MLIYKAGFSVSRPNHIKKYWQDIFVNISSQTIVSQIKTTGTSCKTLYNVLGHTHITVWGLRRCTFFGRGIVYVGGGRFMLDEGRVHLGVELQKSLQILDLAVGSNHV